MRSCYSSKWRFPANPPQEVRGRYFFCNPGTPFYEQPHWFGSQNWQKGDNIDWGPYGEIAGYPQTWFNGSFPTTKPPAVIIGTPACIEDGPPTPTHPLALVSGIDLRCWQLHPPFGGLAGGGNSHFAAGRGGLAGGGSSHFQSTGGGLAGGGDSFVVHFSGGLEGGGGSHFAVTIGGLAGGGDSHFANISGGLAGGGDSAFKEPPFLNLININSAVANTSVDNNCPWGGTTMAGSNLVACLAIKSTNVPTITPPSGWTAGPSKRQGTVEVALFYRPNSASQTTTGNFHVTVSSGQIRTLLTVIEFPLCKTTSPLDKSNTASGTGTSLTTNATGTLSSAFEVIVGFFVIDGLVAITGPGGAWLDAEPADDGVFSVDVEIFNAGAFYTNDYTTASQTLTASASSSHNWAGLIASFLPA